jgi:8-oxo-dGTP diphosphatase
MELLKTLNPEHASQSEYESYPTRQAIRAVVVDDSGNVALLHVAKDGYYKIPGGGVEGDEDHTAALQRECLEEIGCQIEVIGELGRIIEYRKFCELTQVSHCYFAKLKGEKGQPNYTDEEIAEGFQQLWLPYAEALALISANKTENLEGHEYIVPRDKLFLEVAQRYSSLYRLVP